MLTALRHLFHLASPPWAEPKTQTLGLAERGQRLAPNTVGGCHYTVINPSNLILIRMAVQLRLG